MEHFVIPPYTELFSLLISLLAYMYMYLCCSFQRADQIYREFATLFYRDVYCYSLAGAGISNCSQLGFSGTGAISVGAQELY